MRVGRSLSEVGRSLTWTDLRAFIATLGAESYFWKKVAPEAAAKQAQRAEIMQVSNQLLMTIHDTLWDIAHAQAGSEERTPRLLSQLIGDTGSSGAGSSEDVAVAREVAASMRREREGQ